MKQFNFLHDLLLLHQEKPAFRCSHMAGIWLRGRLVSVGYNQRKTHPLQTKFGKNKWAVYLHAEIDAIKNFLKTHTLKDLERSSMFVVRMKHNLLSNSEPCSGCKKAIAHFNIKKVYWS